MPTDKAVEEGMILYHVLRAENKEAKILSKLVLGGVPNHIAMMSRLMEVEMPCTEMLTVCLVTIDQSTPPSWIDDIRDYTEIGALLEDPENASNVKRRAPSYEVVGDQLCKRSFEGPLLKCMLPNQASEVMDEVHGGVCSAHQGANTLSRKILLQGYYWPTMVVDSIARAKACDVCQKFAKKEGRRATFYTPVTTAVPFAEWGVDIWGPLPRALGSVQFCIVAIDYFTK